MTASSFLQAEALGLLEIDGVPRAVRAQDAALKRAPVVVLACAPVSPGKAILLLAGDVASVEEAMKAAEEDLGSRRIDRLFLPGVHPAVIAAVRGDRPALPGASLAIVELETVATTLSCADAAVKMAQVELGRMHLAAGFGGRGYFTLLGAQSELEAAVDAALAAGGAKVLDYEVIPNPHAELEDGAFVRPWSLDPADPPK